MTSTYNPLALVTSQRIDLEKGESRIVLTNKQIAHLRQHGLVAEADEPWRHPAGSFTLSHAIEGNRRERLRPNGTPEVRRDKVCRYCGKAFEPRRPHDSFCSPRCYSRARAGE